MIGSTYVYRGCQSQCAQEQIAEQHSSFLRFNPYYYYYIILPIPGIKHNNKINTHKEEKKKEEEEEESKDYGV